MSSRGRSLYKEMLASTGVWLAGMAVLVFLLMLATLFGPFEIFGDSDSGDFPPRIGLWLPASTPEPAAIRGRKTWHQVAPVETQWRESSSLKELADAGLDVIVLPHARHLSRGEAIELERYVAQGGAALVVGSVAVRDAEDAWRGWETMAALLGVERIVPQPRSASQFVEAVSPPKIPTGLRPGQRVALVPEEGVPALEGAAAPLRWVGAEPGARGSGPGAKGAMLALNRGKGRLLWWAAGPDYAVDADSAAALKQMARAALAWTGQMPFGEFAGDAQERPSVALEVRRVGPRRIEVSLQNSHDEAVAVGAVRIHLYRAIGSAVLRATKVSQELRPKAGLDFEPGALWADLTLPLIPGGSRVAWNLEWSELRTDQTVALEAK